MKRPYTGFDGIGSRLAGTQQFVDYMRFFFRFTNLGTFVVRYKRGSKDSMSVHATGRALDSSYRSDQRDEGRRVANWLVDNADRLGIELVADYMAKPYGRQWRCDRGEWENYEKGEVSSRGYWLHVELSPNMASSKARVKAAWESLFK